MRILDAKGNIPGQRKVMLLQRQILQSSYQDFQLEDFISDLVIASYVLDLSMTEKNRLARYT